MDGWAWAGGRGLEMGPDTLSKRKLQASMAGDPRRGSTHFACKYAWICFFAFIFAVRRAWIRPGRAWIRPFALGFGHTVFWIRPSGLRFAMHAALDPPTGSALGVPWVRPFLHNGVHMQDITDMHLHLPHSLAASAWKACQDLFRTS